MKKIYKSALCLWGAVMLWLLFFRRIGREPAFGQGINLIPFNTVRLFWDMAHNAASIYMTRLAWRNLLGNIFMFTPLGFIPLVAEKVNSFLRYIFLCFGVILSIETIQLLTHLGSFDIDDIILNLFGTVLGYCFILPLDKLINKYILRKGEKL